MMKYFLLISCMVACTPSPYENDISSRNKNLVKVVLKDNIINEDYVKEAVNNINYALNGNLILQFDKPGAKVVYIHHAEIDDYSNDTKHKTFGLNLDAGFMQNIYLISDRISGFNDWMNIITHELMHSIGIKHDPNSILMSEIYSGFEYSGCLERVVLDQFCNVNECKFETISCEDFTNQ